MAAERAPRPACRNCGRDLGSPAEVGWECECGVRVCLEKDCFEQWFRKVADGEATRCLSCGNVV